MVLSIQIILKISILNLSILIEDLKIEVIAASCDSNITELKINIIC